MQNDATPHVDRTGTGDTDATEPIGRPLGVRQGFLDQRPQALQAVIGAFVPLRPLPGTTDRLQIVVEDDSEHLRATEIDADPDLLP